MIKITDEAIIQNWSKDYQNYLIWALEGAIYNYLYLLEFLNQDEMDSLLFGVFMNKSGD